MSRNISEKKQNVRKSGKVYTRAELLVRIGIILAELALGIVLFFLGPKKENAGVFFIALILFAIVWIVGFVCDNHYKTKAVRILFWTTFALLALCVFLCFFCGRVGNIAVMVIGYGTLIFSIIFYIKKISNPSQPQNSLHRNAVEKQKRQREKEDRFLPIGLAVACVFFLLLIGTNGFSYVEGSKLFFVGGGLGLLVGILSIVLILKAPVNVLSAVKAKGEKIAALLLVVMSAVCLGFVTLSALNVSLAKEPEIYTCKIVDKHSGSGRYRTPCADVSFRGKEVLVKVGVDFYTEAQIGDSVSVEYYEGGIGFDYLCIP